MMTFQSFWLALKRCKGVPEDASESKLARCLTLLDLTALGVGSTLGLGIYVLAGAVAKTVAGPAVCISFLVAAIASAFAGLCYAEFASRVPKAGSAYVYSYVSVGEFVAFTIGWNLILEYIIGTASVAKGMSNYIDALASNIFRDGQQSAMPINIDFLSDYPDFFAFFLVFAITLLLAVGVKESSMMNNVLTVLNLITVVIVVVAGSIKADTKNWNLSVDDIPKEYKSAAGVGGFVPFGVAGIMAGAAKCFFGFVGFDCVATTGEEAINPKRNIPLSIVLSLIIIFISYFSVSTVLTLTWPYYLQDADAPFPHAFEEVGMPVIKWIVTIGAIFALCTSLLGALFPLPRIFYAMGNDGVLFRVLAKINTRTSTPLLATLVAGLLSAIMALIFNLNQLIDMMSIGTLMAYTIVAISVLVLRYEVDPKGAIAANDDSYKYSVWEGIKQCFNVDKIKYPMTFSHSVVKVSIVMFCIFTLIFCAILYWIADLAGIIVASVSGVLLIITFIIIQRQPMQNVDLSFKVPLVPLVPVLSIFMNLYLMVQLDIQTWIRFVVWLIIGYMIYFGYGIRNSTEGQMNKKEEMEAAEQNNSTPEYTSAYSNNGYVPDVEKQTIF